MRIYHDVDKELDRRERTYNWAHPSLYFLLSLVFCFTAPPMALVLFIIVQLMYSAMLDDNSYKFFCLLRSARILSVIGVVVSAGVIVFLYYAWGEIV